MPNKHNNCAMYDGVMADGNVMMRTHDSLLYTLNGDGGNKTFAHSLKYFLMYCLVSFLNDDKRKITDKSGY